MSGVGQSSDARLSVAGLARGVLSQSSRAATAQPAAAIRRCEGQVALSDWGLRYWRSWLPAAPTRAMVLVHGYAEHAGRYDEMASHFARQGYAVYAYDQAGHGRTRGTRGHVDRFSRLLDELARFVEQVADEQPGLPLALVGHSMGGLVTAATAALRRPAVDRVVLSAPAVDLGGGGKRALQAALARAISPILPRFGQAVGLDPRGLSRDPEVVRRYVEDPYVRDRMSSRFATGMRATVSALGGGRLRRSSGRCSCCTARRIRSCRGSGSERLPSRHSPPSIAPRSRFKLYPQLRHEIFNEPERERVWQDMNDFGAGRMLRRRSPERAGRNEDAPIATDPSRRAGTRSHGERRREGGDPSRLHRPRMRANGCPRPSSASSRAASRRATSSRRRGSPGSRRRSGRASGFRWRIRCRSTPSK